jgi:hypothetical protein
MVSFNTRQKLLTKINGAVSKKFGTEETTVIPHPGQ